MFENTLYLHKETKIQQFINVCETIVTYLCFFLQDLVTFPPAAMTTRTSDGSDQFVGQNPCVAERVHRDFLLEEVKPRMVSPAESSPDHHRRVGRNGLIPGSFSPAFLLVKKNRENCRNSPIFRYPLAVVRGELKAFLFHCTVIKRRLERLQ